MKTKLWSHICSDEKWSSTLPKGICSAISSTTVTNQNTESVRIQLSLSQQLPTLASGNSCSYFIHLLRKAIIPRIKILLLQTEKTTWAAALCGLRSLSYLGMPLEVLLERAYPGSQNSNCKEQREKPCESSSFPSWPTIICRASSCQLSTAAPAGTRSSTAGTAHGKTVPTGNTVHNKHCPHQPLPTAHGTEHNKPQHTTCGAVTVTRLLN